MLNFEAKKGKKASLEENRPITANVANIDCAWMHKHTLRHLQLCITTVLLIGIIVTIPKDLFEVRLVTASLGPTFLPTDPIVAEREESKTSRTKQILKPPFIQDVVLLPEEVLLLVWLPTADYRLPRREEVSCRFSPHTRTEVRGMEHGNGRAKVRCGLPSDGFDVLPGVVVLVESISGAVISEGERMEHSSLKKWSSLVYELWATDDDIVLLAKGLNNRQGRNAHPSSLRCVYNGEVETIVTVSSQEVFRCMHPSPDLREMLIGKVVTLKLNGNLLDSVAYYEPKSKRHFGSNTFAEDQPRMNLLCACTMVYNTAKFMKEWVIYHSHIGVGHFFVYDNNSEDQLEEVVQTLASFNVTRYPWPWAKTQEAGFSHCALQTQNMCKWMIFVDVDEFIYPAEWLDRGAKTFNESGKTSGEILSTDGSKGGSKALQELVLETSAVFNENLLNFSSGRRISSDLPGDLNSGKKVGQIYLSCRDFGPSGMKEHPSNGVTQGYTCRLKKESRHKSIVLLEAIPKPLLNVIHHFELSERYASVRMESSRAVVNHYKYQAWSEFRSKFRRRVSTYVVDWKEAKNAGSKDRAPGLGYEEIKPEVWEESFCEVEDTGLKSYVLKLFSLDAKGSSKMELL